MEKQLPKNWVECTLGELATVQSGGTPARGINSYWNGDIPWAKISDIKEMYVDKTTEFITEEGLKNSSTRIFPKGTILFTIFATLGKIGILNIDAATNQAIAGITPSKAIDDKYLTYALIDLSNSISEYGKGVAQKNINQAILKDTIIPLPPLAEQNRIVDKLDRLFAQLETIKTSMANIPLLLKDFRQQVLTQAVTGKLTEEWRKGRELESGKDLLKKIKAKRLEIHKNQCLEAVKNGKRKPKQPILDIVDDNKRNFLIPDNWIYCTIGDVGNVSNGSTPSRPISEYWNGNIPWISSGLVRNNRISIANEHLTELGFENSSVRLLPKGSILLAMIGEGKTRGQSSILDIDATINQNVAGISLEHGLVISEYLQNWLFVNYENNREMGNGTGPQALNCQKVRELPFVLPPFLEQQEIVSRVESLFAKAHAIEQQYQSLKEKIDTLPQALLHKAFKGELTEQLESDGDARELLQQIQELKLEISKKEKKR